MSSDENIGANKSLWDFIKGFLYSILRLGGERSVIGAWMIYSMARVFINTRFRKTFTKEPESEYIIGRLRKGQVCVDIGANTGDYTHLFSRLVGPSGRVYSIEPNPGVFRILSKRVVLIRLKNVRCHQIGLGEHVGVGKLIGGIVRPGNRAFAHLLSSDMSSNHIVQEVALTTLDNFATEQDTGHIDFIKCDVEGFELMVLRGGQNVLKHDCPIVLCEVEDRWMRYGCATSDVFLMFHNLGYESYVWENGELSIVDGVLPKTNNYIFLPREHADGDEDNQVEQNG